MHASLAIQELGGIGERYHGAVPDVRMDVETAAPVAIKRDKLFRPYLVARQRQRHDKTLAMQRIKHLAAVGVVIGAPDQRPLARPERPVGSRLLRPIAPSEQIGVADRIVARVKRLALPGKFEDASTVPP